MAIYWNAARRKWIAQVTYQGLRDSRTCATKKAARDAEAEIRGALKAKAVAQEAEEQAPATLRKLCEGYELDLKDRGRAPDSIARARDTRKRLDEFFGKRMDEPLELTAAELVAFCRDRKEGGAAASTINRDLRNVRAMLKKALPDFTFPKGLFRPEDGTRVRWLEPLQEVDVMSRLRSPFREMADLARLTLMRLSEVRTLRRQQVFLSQGIIHLPAPKGGEPQVVVLNGEAQALLRQQLEVQGGEWVFPAPHGACYSRVHVSRMWREAARAAGLMDFAFHDLRHHGSTMALNAGFTGDVVQELGRWKTPKMMRRYAAVTSKTLRAAAEAVAGNMKRSRELLLEAARAGTANAECKPAAASLVRE